MTFDVDIYLDGSSWPYLGQVRKGKVIGQSSRSQEETTALANTVCMMNVYTGGGFWQIRLNQS